MVLDRATIKDMENEPPWLCLRTEHQGRCGVHTGSSSGRCKEECRDVGSDDRWRMENEATFSGGGEEVVRTVWGASMKIMSECMSRLRDRKRGRSADTSRRTRMATVMMCISWAEISPATGRRECGSVARQRRCELEAGHGRVI